MHRTTEMESANQVVTTSEDMNVTKNVPIEVEDKKHDIETEPLNSTLNSESGVSFSPSDSSIRETSLPTTPAEEKGGNTCIKKSVFAHLPLLKLWFVLILTLGFTVVLLVASHLTHSLTLRIEAYHALYNVLALVGCLITMKVSLF